MFKLVIKLGQIIYQIRELIPALEWLANLCSHIPNRGEQMVRYYGWYSNVSRGKRQMAGKDDGVPCILESLGGCKGLPEKLGQAYSENLRTILQLHLIQQVRTKYFK